MSLLCTSLQAGGKIQPHEVAVENRKLADARTKEARDAWIADWIRFACDIPNMPVTQVACFAIGAVMLLNCSSIGRLALGTGLTLFSAANLAKNTYETLNIPHEDQEVSAAP